MYWQHKVSFVSVTQDLNTDSAMGRLVLNILQSFAQFEREIASERIKDKIFMSKKRGMWMGGTIPIGYDSNEGKLSINKAEAEIIRFIFKSFIETASATEVVKRLKSHGYQTKSRVSRRGKVTSPRNFTKTSLYKILGNKVYIGQIEHKARGETYEGKHDAIIDMKTWNQVQAILDGNKMTKINFSKEERPYLLRGLLRSPDGYAMTPATAKKGDLRYRYYVNVKANKTFYDDCTLKTVSAPLIEEIVLEQARRMLTSSEWIQRMLASNPETKANIVDVRAALDHFDLLWAELFPAEQARIIQLVVRKVTIYPNKITLQFQPAGLVSVLQELIPDLTFDAKAKPEIFDPLEMTIPIDFRKRKNRNMITTPDGKDLTKSLEPKFDNPLVKAIVRAHQWEEMIESGEAGSIADIAKREKLDRGYVTNVIRLTALAPDITTAILNGRQPQTLQLASIIRSTLPYDWAAQREMLGFDTAAEA